MPFTEDVERYFEVRLERLVKLHKLHAPWPIIARELVLIVKAITLIDKAKFWEEWADMMRPGFRSDAGFCAECGNEHIPETLCLDCQKTIEEIDRSEEP
jgi:hypothetical protein